MISDLKMEWYVLDTLEGYENVGQEDLSGTVFVQTDSIFSEDDGEEDEEDEDDTDSDDIEVGVAITCSDESYHKMLSLLVDDTTSRLGVKNCILNFKVMCSYNAVSSAGIWLILWVQLMFLNDPLDEERLCIKP